jgi:hypothetical protein
MEARANAVNDRVDSRLRELGADWSNDRRDFDIRVRRLLELWSIAKKSISEEFAAALRSDLVAAAQWAYRLFDCDFEELALRIGNDDFEPELSLGAALTPVSEDARRIASNVLPHFVESFNVMCSRAALSVDDIAAFNKYLESHDLGSWHLEFGALIREMRDPTDTTFEKRFLHLRSLALLLEALLAPLVEERGTAEDVARLKHRNIKESMKVFLGGRNDWRAVLWQCVATNWELTRVREGNFAERLAALTSTDVNLCYDHPEQTAMARCILLQSASRNFGSHRFTNDRELLDRHFGDMLTSVVYCAIFYWKVSYAQ